MNWVILLWNDSPSPSLALAAHGNKREKKKQKLNPLNDMRIKTRKARDHVLSAFNVTGQHDFPSLRPGVTAGSFYLCHESDPYKKSRPAGISTGANPQPGTSFCLEESFMHTWGHSIQRHFFLSIWKWSSVLPHLVRDHVTAVSSRAALPITGALFELITLRLTKHKHQCL